MLVKFCNTCSNDLKILSNTHFGLLISNMNFTLRFRNPKNSIPLKFSENYLFIPLKTEKSGFHLQLEVCLPTTHLKQSDLLCCRKGFLLIHSFIWLFWYLYRLPLGKLIFHLLKITAESKNENKYWLQQKYNWLERKWKVKMQICGQ